MPSASVLPSSSALGVAVTEIDVAMFNRWTGVALMADGTLGTIVGMIDEDGRVTIDPDEAVTCVIEFLGYGYCVVRVSDYTSRCIQ